MSAVNEINRVLEKVRTPIKVSVVCLGVGMLGLAAAQTVEAAGLHLPLLQGPLWPVELGNTFLANLIEYSINKPVDSIAELGIIGGVIGGIRLLTQLPAIYRQISQAGGEGQQVNYSALIARLGGSFYDTVLREGLQWARLPVLISATYYMNSLAEMVPAELSGQLRVASLLAAAVTFVSTLEALNPLS